MKVPFSSLWRKGKSKPVSPGRRRTAKVNARAAGPPGAAWPPARAAAIAWINESGASVRSTAQLENRSADSLHLHLDEAIGINQAVWTILDDGTDLPGKIQKCEGEEQGFRVQIAAMKGTESSLAGGAHTQLKWLDPTGHLNQAAVSLKNADQGRLQVVTNEKLEAPAIVLLAGKGFQCLGSVNGCAPHEDRWTLDLEVLGEAYARPIATTAGGS